MKVLITGAHFTPAQALIEELKKIPDVKIVYVGRKYTLEKDSKPSIESQILPGLGIKFIPITAGRVRRVLEFTTLISFLKIPIGFLQALLILIVEKPDVVLSFGGYVGVSVVIPAWFLNIPVILHEQTLVSGLANKVSSFFAKKIAVTFDKKYSFPKNKIVVTGNPFRKELLEENIKPSEDVSHIMRLKQKLKYPLIYITGGNQGSHVINDSVLKIINELSKKALVIHQTGDSSFNDYDKLLEQKKIIKNPENYLIKKWFNVKDVSAIYRKADLVISRGGANTLIELAYFGIPTIVIPIPYLYQDEQNVNAKYFEEKGLVQILPQPHLNDQTLFNKINNSLKNLNQLKNKAKESKGVVILNAEQKIIQEILVVTPYNG